MVQLYEKITYGLFKRRTIKFVHKAGYGRCSRCSCAGFEPDYRNHDVCSNCGHNYNDHY